MGCGKPAADKTDWNSFGRQWQKASIREKKQMIDLSKIGEEFNGKDRGYVMEIFGKPSSEGENDFGEHEIRYDFDPYPDTDGELLQHFSFALEHGRVVRVEASLISD